MDSFKIHCFTRTKGMGVPTVTNTTNKTHIIHAKFQISNGLWVPLHETSRSRSVSVTKAMHRERGGAQSGLGFNGRGKHEHQSVIALRATRPESVARVEMAPRGQHRAAAAAAVCRRGGSNKDEALPRSRSGRTRPDLITSHCSRSVSELQHSSIVCLSKC